MAVGEDVVGADGLTNRERFEMRREKKRKEKEAREAAKARAKARAEAEAAGNPMDWSAAPAPSGDGMLSSQQPQITGTNPFGQPSAYYETYVDDYGNERSRPNRAYWDELNRYSGEERRYRELLMRGAIDEEGNIYGGINPTEIMRGDPPSWANPELIKNAYIRAFESKARGGQNFMDSGDYQNFLNAGYSLTDEQIASLGGVQGQGNQNDLTFGGGQTTTGVANPPPQNTTNPADAPMSDDTFETDRDTYTSSGDEFLEGYNTNQPEEPAPIDPTQPVATQNTPFADAYFKAMEAAKKKGPVSSMFADMLPGE